MWDVEDAVPYGLRDSKFAALRYAGVGVPYERKAMRFDVGIEPYGRVRVEVQIATLRSQ